LKYAYRLLIPFLLALVGVVAIVSSANSSPPSFWTVDTIFQIVAGALLLIAAYGIWRANRRGMNAESLPDTLWKPLTEFALIMAACWFVSGALALKFQPNSIQTFIGTGDRKPVLSVPQYGNQTLQLILALSAVWVLTHLPAAVRAQVSAVGRALFDTWKSIRFRSALGMAALLLLTLFNISHIVLFPIRLRADWDMEAAVWRGSKEEQLTQVLGGLNAGCMLCTPDRAPIENITKGDDLGLYFLFGLVTRLGIPPTLLSYQWFVALTTAGIILAGSLIVAVGWRSVLAGLIFCIFFSLFDPFNRYESMLTTSYWTPAGAAILSGGLALAFLARIQRQALTPRFTLAGFAAWGLVAGFAYICRSSAGVVTLLSAFAVGALVLLSAPAPQRRPLLALPLPLLVGLLLPVLALRFTLNWRMSYYQLQPLSADATQSHAFSHAVLVGLGYVQNDWRITWSDTIGQKWANATCPGVVYLSYDYYNCIRNVVVQIALKDPNLYFRNILAKLESIVQTTFTFLPLGFWLPAFIPLLRRREYLILIPLVLFQTIPGLMAVPYFSYIQGYFGMLILIMAAGLIHISISLGDYYGKQAAAPAVEENVYVE
jgi:hypothetical protein